MINKLLITVAASALLTVPAFAQESAGGEASQATEAAAPAAAETQASSMAADPAPAAATGTATDTSGVVGIADLKAGAAVRDAAGMKIGKIAKVEPGAAGAAATVTLDVDGQMAAVPATSLTLSDGALVSSRTKAEILAGAR